MSKRKGPGPAAMDGPAEKRARRALFALLALFTAALAWREEASLDFGTLLTQGRYILERHALPHADVLSYAVPPVHYVDASWLFQALLAAVFSFSGFLGMGVIRELCVLPALAFTWASARRRGARSPALLAGGFALGIVAWEPRFFVRPEIASYLFLAAELYLLRRWRERRDSRWMLACLALQVVWTQCHGLSFLGPVMLGIEVLADALSRRRLERGPWLLAAASAATQFVGPYGFGILGNIASLGAAFRKGGFVAGSTYELFSPFSQVDFQQLPLLAFKAFFVGAALALLLRARRTALADLGSAGVCLVLGATARRNFGLCVLGVLPPALEAAQGLLDGWAARGRRLPPALAARAPIAWLALGAALLYGSYSVAAGGYYAGDERIDRFGYRESGFIYPAGCTDYILAHHLGGPMFNCPSLGGYLARRFWPERRVFGYGQIEAIGEDFFRENMAILDGSAWEEAEHRYGFRLALLEHDDERLAQKLMADSTWALLDVDGHGLLFAKRTPDVEPLVREAAARWRRMAAAGLAAPELAPRPDPPIPARWFLPRHFPWAAWGVGRGFHVLGMIEAARLGYGRAVLASERDEPRLALGYAGINLELGRNEEALRWYRRVLQLAPESAVARHHVEELESAGR